MNTSQNKLSVLRLDIAYASYKLIKEIAYYSPLRRFFFYRYRYMFSPQQLAFFLNCIDDTRGLPGAILEIGCALGHTTVWLNKHLDTTGIEKDYFCIDTFAGFTRNDTDFEVKQREKEANLMRMSGVGLSVNRKKWFDRTMQDNGISRVRSLQGDIGTLQVKTITPRISFCLIDVDLYLPVKAALEQVYPLMDKNGIIVVDDCKSDNIFDGAYQAYSEFISQKGLEEKIVQEKLGVIYT